MRGRSRRCRERGLSLVELLVAIVIATVFLIGAIPMFASALRATRSDTARVAAQAIAQQKMEQIRQLEFSQLSHLTDGTNLGQWMNGAYKTSVVSYVGSAGKTYTVSYAVTYGATDLSLNAAQYARVTVTVSWADVSGGTGHVALATLISRRFAGPPVSKVTLDPVTLDSVTGRMQLRGQPTIITIYIPAQYAGANNSRLQSVTVTVADLDNSNFVPRVLTATAVSNGMFTASWNQASAPPNDTYSFTARASYPNVTNPSDEILGTSFTVNAQLVPAASHSPSPVANFPIVAGDQRLLLTWDASLISDFDHYELRRGTSPSPMAVLASDLHASCYIDMDQSSGTGTGLRNDITYYYEVRVVNTEGAASAWVPAHQTPAAQTDTTTPSTPAAFRAIRDNSSAVLSWSVPTAGSSGIAGYLIYRDALPYYWYPGAGGELDSVVQFTDALIFYSTAHTYAVVTVSGVGLMSPPSNTETVGVGTAPTATLTVTTKQAGTVSIDVVQTDVQPDFQDWGTKTATSVSLPAAWTLPAGSYTITATYGGSQIVQNVILSQSRQVESGF
jgi:Tfp pilus assembly protein PilV